MEMYGVRAEPVEAVKQPEREEIRKIERNRAGGDHAGKTFYAAFRRESQELWVNGNGYDDGGSNRNCLVRFATADPD
ncbi:uncharacterized protein PADG_11106 [Paracoccidioides brasiliensis Pb18]|uniref:Uncharacterized protein n=1 Tax=Paracoccidioides brasiliensis (strain Pb18) TaxID=502780 RepID=A0A0A0HW86_PARBD|nr:uncharacterized protein PADG_11106 [Paracoccidioides brasiliensis Pb18]KGM92653.1 hypothetical protein PADG_11106 [Paracoccidioides brasiliensis Pb18]